MLSSKLIPLTGAQKNSLMDVADAPIKAPSFAQTGEANPNLRVFIANFDGTWNARHNVPKDEHQTLVAESHEILEANESPSISSRYYKGVGTEGSKARRMRDGALGIGCVETAKIAYQELVEQVAQWRSKNPGIEVHVHVVGFSRGCATAMKFMHHVDNLGILTPTKAVGLAPGQVRTSAVLIDAVTTGVKAEHDLQLPPSNVATLHITAGGEERPGFSLTTLVDDLRPSEIAFAKNVFMEGNEPGKDGLINYRRLHEIVLAGARHSDAGGCYVDGSIRELSMYLMREYQRSLGLPVHGVKPPVELIQSMMANDSRWIKGVGDIGDRQAATRDIALRPERVWEGIYSERVSVKLGSGEQGVWKHLQRVATVGPSRRQTIQLADLGKKHSLKLTTEMVQDGVLTLPDPKFSFEEGTGVLLLSGIAVQSAPCHDEMVRVIVNHREVTVEIGHEKALPIFDAKQRPVERPHEVAPTEDWPAPLKRLLQVINQRGSKYTEAQGKMVFKRCLDAAAEAISSGFGPVTVRGIETSLNEVCTNFDFDFALQINPAAAQQADLKTPLWRHELNIAVNKIERALQCISQAMTDQGMEPPEMGVTTFSAAAPASGRPYTWTPPALGGSVLSGRTESTQLDEAAPVRPQLRVVGGYKM